jgi:hypothetical protein
MNFRKLYRERQDRETPVEQKTCEYAKADGWENRKMGQNGDPDRLFWKDNVYVWIELKRPGKDIHPLSQQALRKRELRLRCCWVGSFDNAGKAREFLARCYKAEKRGNVVELTADL